MADETVSLREAKPTDAAALLALLTQLQTETNAIVYKIGRASCRERV